MRVGFEVRVDVQIDGAPVQVIVTRAEARHLGLEVGDEAWVSPTPGAVLLERTSAALPAEVAGPTPVGA